MPSSPLLPGEAEHTRTTRSMIMSLPIQREGSFSGGPDKMPIHPTGPAYYGSLTRSSARHDTDLDDAHRRGTPICHRDRDDVLAAEAGLEDQGQAEVDDDRHGAAPARA